MPRLHGTGSPLGSPRRVALTEERRAARLAARTLRRSAASTSKAASGGGATATAPTRAAQVAAAAIAPTVAAASALPPTTTGSAQRDARGNADAALLDARTITIGQHLFACAPPALGGQQRPFEVDVSLVCDLTALGADGRSEFPIDESVELCSDSGVNVPSTLPPKRPRYVVGAANSRSQTPPTFFPWERRARRPDAIAGKQAFEHGSKGGPRGGGAGAGAGPYSRWCRQAVDPSLVKLEDPPASELRMTVLRQMRVVAHQTT